MPSPADSPLTPVRPAPFTVPAAAVIAECLRAQDEASPRGAIARVLGLSPLTDESRPWYVGALGERIVAERLSRLGEGWTVLHAVPIGKNGSDIDHVAIGAAGVFTINTKLHDGARIWLGEHRLLVNGQKTDHLRNSRFEARRVGVLLSEAVGVDVSVTAVVAIARAREITVKKRPRDVVVVREQDLARTLRRRASSITDEVRDRVVAVASDPRTWSPTVDSPHPDIDRFDRLVREVRAAHRVRIVWAAAGLLALVTVAWRVGPALPDLVTGLLTSGM